MAGCERLKLGARGLERIDGVLLAGLFVFFVELADAILVADAERVFDAESFPNRERPEALPSVLRSCLSCLARRRAISWNSVGRWL